ncbi:MAG: class D beta-lactamase [Tannerellaceae bacterium]|nr:class D beta-lactamase [Tannerellaceae bacterium]
MKKYLFSLILVSLFSGIRAAEPQELPQLKALFDSFGVYGSIVIYDQQNNHYMGYNLERCNEAFGPASSFKIANTLIALETGVATPQTVFKWNGEKQRLQVWEQDVNLRQAFQISSVPVYQEIARRIGAERMQYYLRLFNYGEMDVHPDNIDLFWLEGESQITPYQQVYFLQKLYNLQLPVSRKAMEQTKAIMVHEEKEGYTLSGKTGWATRQEKDVTWFVGYLETKGNVYIFATNLEPCPTTDPDSFAQTRIRLTKEVFRTLGLMNS